MSFVVLQRPEQLYSSFRRKNPRQKGNDCEREASMDASVFPFLNHLKYNEEVEVNNEAE